MKLTLKSARLINDMTQEEVCSRIGIAIPTLRGWENDIRCISVGRLMELSKLYGVPINQFFLPDDED